MGPHLHRHLLLFVLALGLARPVEPPAPKPEYLVKARLIQVLTRYVTWPDKAEQGTALIAVVGDSPFEAHLEAVLAPPGQQGALQVMTYARMPRRMDNTKVLFICESEASRLPQILSAVKGQPLLTVSDQPGFAGRGVMVNLVYQDGHVVIEVNHAAIQEANLRISSQVLKLARIVGGPPKEQVP